MIRWQRFALLLALLVGLNIAVIVVLRTNFMNDLYPPESDTIIIPIMNTAILSLVAVAALGIIFALVRNSEHSRSQHRGPLVRTARAVAMLLLYLYVLAFGVDIIAEWSIPNHFVVAIAGGIFTAGALDLMIRDVKVLLSNNRVECTRDA